MNEFKLVVNQNLPVYKSKNDVLCSLEDPAAQVVSETRKIIKVFNNSNDSILSIRDIKRNFDRVLCKRTNDEKLKNMLTFLSFLKEEVYIHIVFNGINWLAEYDSLVDWYWLEDTDSIHNNEAKIVIKCISEFMNTINININKVLVTKEKELENSKEIIDKSLVWYEKWKYEIYEKLLSLKESPDILRKILIAFYNRTISNDYYYKCTRTYKRKLVEDKEFIYFRNLIRYLYWNEELNNKKLFNEIMMFFWGYSDNISDEILFLISAKMHTYWMNINQLLDYNLNSKIYL